MIEMYKPKKENEIKLKKFLQKKDKKDGKRNIQRNVVG